MLMTTLRSIQESRMSPFIYFFVDENSGVKISKFGAFIRIITKNMDINGRNSKNMDANKRYGQKFDKIWI